MGKEGEDFMRKSVYRHLGRFSRKVLVGPGWGLDNGVVSAGRGRVLIVTVDPVSAIPAFGMELSAWTSVHLIASDYATSGAEPEYATFSYDFPPRMTQVERESYVNAIGNECDKLGVSIVGGHTGSYSGGGFTVIGTGSMIGFCGEGDYVTPKMARAGDAILLTKHPAIEAAASLAICFPSYTEEKVGASSQRRVQKMIRLCSTVKDAVVAARAGLGPEGVTSMHDVTEGGVLGALLELSMASGRRFEVDTEAIAIPDEVGQVCAAFGINPLTSLGEGALLLTCTPSAKVRVVKLLSQANIGARQIGVVGAGSGLWIRKGEAGPRRLKAVQDHYWSAYERAVAQGFS